RLRLQHIRGQRTLLLLGRREIAGNSTNCQSQNRYHRERPSGFFHGDLLLEGLRGLIVGRPRRSSSFAAGRADKAGRAASTPTVGPGKQRLRTSEILR